jgi:uncharacterized protein (TIGR02145 family)
MKYRSKVVWCLCLFLAGLGIVAVVPHIAHAATICNACKGTGRDICKFCGGRGCAQCNWKGGSYVDGFYGSCKYCGGTGEIYTAAEKAAMKKAADAKQAAAEAEQQAVQEALVTFTDSRDGKTYRKVVIGNQTWMAENLNYDVPNNTTDVCYENRPNNCAKYGRLYNWETAMDGSPSSKTNPSGVQGVCPSGWHLPSEGEWLKLTNVESRKIKSKSGWEKNGNGTNEFMFSALPGGYGSLQYGGGFFGAGSKGRWWSTNGGSYGDELYARYCFIMWGVEYAGGSDSFLQYDEKFSVRCVAD